ncbi:MAG: type II secretion system protein [Verrucomicrobiales bacterium]|nr:type II secretion system protein [Verrucomicrobiales bacterium]
MRPTSSHHAFTLPELLVVITVLSVLTLLFLPAHASGRNKSQRILCINNLKQLGIAFRLEDQGPGSAAERRRQWTDSSHYYQWFLSYSNSLSSPRFLVCPTDRPQRASPQTWSEFAAPEARNRAISYFGVTTADETRPQIPLFGDRSFEAQPPLPAFSYHSPKAVMGSLTGDSELIRSNVAWTPDAMHRGAGNVALSDGSVQQLTSARLGASLTTAGSPAITLIQPGNAPD